MAVVASLLQQQLYDDAVSEMADELRRNASLLEDNSDSDTTDNAGRKGNGRRWQKAQAEQDVEQQQQQQQLAARHARSELRQRKRTGAASGAEKVSDWLLNNMDWRQQFQRASPAGISHLSLKHASRLNAGVFAGLLSGANGWRASSFGPNGGGGGGGGRHVVSRDFGNWWLRFNLRGKLEGIFPVISPEGRGKMAWDVLIMALVLYSAVTVPLAFSYGLPNTGGLAATEWVLTALYVMDIGVSFRTAYFDDDGNLVRDTWPVARHYLGSWFAVDLAATFPYDAVGMACGLGHSQSQLTILAVLKTPRLLRLIKLMRLLDRMRNANILKVVQLVGLMMMIAHWLACIWFFISKYAPEQERWGFGDTSGDNKLSWYLCAFYHSFLLLIGDNISAYNNYERVFFIVSLIAGACFYSAVVGNMALLVANMNTVAVRFRQKLDMTQEALRYMRVPEAQRERVQAFYDYITSYSHPSAEGFSFLSDLTKGISEDVHMFLHSKALMRIYLFKECEPAFIRALGMRMKIVTFIPREVIFRQGDLGHEMYIIRSGCVAVVSRNNEVMSLLQAGDFFGEIALLTQARRTAKCLALSTCDLAVLHSFDLKVLLKTFPDSAHRLQAVARDRLRQLQIAGRAGTAGADDGDEGEDEEDEDTRVEAERLRRLRTASITRFFTGRALQRQYQRQQQEDEEEEAVGDLELREEGQQQSGRSHPQYRRSLGEGEDAGDDMQYRSMGSTGAPSPSQASFTSSVRSGSRRRGTASSWSRPGTASACGYISVCASPLPSGVGGLSKHSLSSEGGKAPPAFDVGDGRCTAAVRQSSRCSSSRGSGCCSHKTSTDGRCGNDRDGDEAADTVVAEGFRSSGADDPVGLLIQKLSEESRISTLDAGLADVLCSGRSGGTGGRSLAGCGTTSRGAPGAAMPLLTPPNRHQGLLISAAPERVAGGSACDSLSGETSFLTVAATPIFAISGPSQDGSPPGMQHPAVPSGGTDPGVISDASSGSCRGVGGPTPRTPSTCPKLISPGGTAAAAAAGLDGTAPSSGVSATVRRLSTAATATVPAPTPRMPIAEGWLQYDKVERFVVPLRSSSSSLEHRVVRSSQSRCAAVQRNGRESSDPGSNCCQMGFEIVLGQMGCDTSTGTGPGPVAEGFETARSPYTRTADGCQPMHRTASAVATLSLPTPTPSFTASLLSVTGACASNSTMVNTSCHGRTPCQATTLGSGPPPPPPPGAAWLPPPGAAASCTTTPDCSVLKGSTDRTHVTSIIRLSTDRTSLLSDNGGARPPAVALAASASASGTGTGTTTATATITAGMTPRGRDSIASPSLCSSRRSSWTADVGAQASGPRPASPAVPAFGRASPRAGTPGSSTHNHTGAAASDTGSVGIAHPRGRAALQHAGAAAAGPSSAYATALAATAASIAAIAHTQGHALGSQQGPHGSLHGTAPRVVHPGAEGPYCVRAAGPSGWQTAPVGAAGPSGWQTAPVGAVNSSSCLQADVGTEVRKQLSGLLAAAAPMCGVAPNGGAPMEPQEPHLAAAGGAAGGSLHLGDTVIGGGSLHLGNAISGGGGSGGGGGDGPQPEESFHQGRGSGKGQSPQASNLGYANALAATAASVAAMGGLQVLAHGHAHGYGQGHAHPHGAQRASGTGMLPAPSVRSLGSILRPHPEDSSCHNTPAGVAAASTTTADAVDTATSGPAASASSAFTFTTPTPATAAFGGPVEGGSWHNFGRPAHPLGGLPGCQRSLEGVAPANLMHLDIQGPVCMRSAAARRAEAVLHPEGDVSTSVRGTHAQLGGSAASSLPPPPPPPLATAQQLMAAMLHNGRVPARRNTSCEALAADSSWQGSTVEGSGRGPRRHASVELLQCPPPLPPGCEEAGRQDHRAGRHSEMLKAEAELHRREAELRHREMEVERREADLAHWQAEAARALAEAAARHEELLAQLERSRAVHTVVLGLAAILAELSAQVEALSERLDDTDLSVARIEHQHGPHRVDPDFLGLVGPPPLASPRAGSLDGSMGVGIGGLGVGSGGMGGLLERALSIGLGGGGGGMDKKGVTGQAPLLPPPARSRRGSVVQFGDDVLMADAGTVLGMELGGGGGGGGGFGDKSVRGGGSFTEKSARNGGIYRDKSVRSGGAFGERSVRNGGGFAEKSIRNGGAYGEKSVRSGGAFGDRSMRNGGALSDKSARNGGRNGASTTSLPLGATEPYPPDGGTSTKPQQVSGAKDRGREGPPLHSTAPVVSTGSFTSGQGVAGLASREARPVTSPSLAASRKLGSFGNGGPLAAAASSGGAGAGATDSSLQVPSALPVSVTAAVTGGILASLVRSGSGPWRRGRRSGDGSPVAVGRIVGFAGTTLEMENDTVERQR